MSEEDCLVFVLLSNALPCQPLSFVDPFSFPLIFNLILILLFDPLTFPAAIFFDSHPLTPLTHTLSITMELLSPLLVHLLARKAQD